MLATLTLPVSRLGGLVLLSQVRAKLRFREQPAPTPNGYGMCTSPHLSGQLLLGSGDGGGGGAGAETTMRVVMMSMAR
jgi:hypothetical protein